MDKFKEWSILLLAKSAEQGDKEAQYTLGERYELGTNGVTKNIEKAIYWYSQAVEQGYKKALEKLDSILLFGEDEAKKYAMIQKKAREEEDLFGEDDDLSQKNVSKDEIKHLLREIGKDEKQVRQLSEEQLSLLKQLGKPIEDENKPIFSKKDLNDILIEYLIEFTDKLDEVNREREKDSKKIEELERKCKYLPKPPKIKIGDKIDTKALGTIFIEDIKLKVSNHINNQNQIHYEFLVKYRDKSHTWLSGKTLEDMINLTGAYNAKDWK